MTRRRVDVSKNDGKRLRAICKGKSCEWYVYARKIETHNNTDFVVVNMHRDHAHTCSQVLEQRWLTSKWLAERYMEKIKANPHIPLVAIRQCVDEEFGLKVGRKNAYRARDSALECIFGKAGLQYRRLFDYKAELERTHVDSSVHIHYENLRDTEAVGPRFLWFYSCLRPLKKEDIHLQENAPRFVFMSDQQKGLAKAILEDFPQSEHRFCVHHIYNNFKKRFIGENFKEILWELASSTTHEQLISLRMFVAMLSSTIFARELAIITMLEEIRTSQMERIQIRGQWIKTYDHTLPPVIKEIVDKLFVRASSWRSTWNGEDSYQVSGPSGQYVVNMREFTCSCRVWQLTGIPYTHAISTINKIGKDVADYVSRYYLRSTMTLLYENVLYPINEMDNWPKTSEVGFELAPPRTKQQRGRPKKLRREEPQMLEPKLDRVHSPVSLVSHPQPMEVTGLSRLT
ncbi:uncharacterized protein LOC121760399 [Salvia splendens]|uniref:uncharacterized protein LOC121760399 n=1 Tax=Salvia splendens TaxID=180675 RepID=UPI001C275875|nr:uncharacterized protein LOC121760399 [Salvia splendens]